MQSIRKWKKRCTLITLSYHIVNSSTDRKGEVPFGECLLDDDDDDDDDDDNQDGYGKCWTSESE
jgi:hypothetical protein